MFDPCLLKACIKSSIFEMAILDGIGPVRRRPLSCAMGEIPYPMMLP